MSSKTAAFYVQKGDLIDWIADDTYPAGSVVVQNNLIGVTTEPVVSGQRTALTTSGVVSILKASADIAAGKPVYWQSGDGNISEVTDGKYIGLTTVASIATDDYVPVLLVKDAPGSILPTPTNNDLTVSAVVSTATSSGKELPAATAAVYLIKGVDSQAAYKVVINAADQVKGRVITIVETQGKPATIAPVSGGKIDGGAANAAITIAANQAITLFCVVDTTGAGEWVTIAATPIAG
jgi:predicted RecA/RadA family phage recombinase